MLPGLAKELFEEAVLRIISNDTLLADRGWLLLCWDFPLLRVAIRHRKTGKLRVFDLTFDDWNDQPPSLQLVDAETLEPLPGCRWPRDSSARWHDNGWISPNGIQTIRPFMCMVGIREYHTHHSHTNDNWSNYRDLPDYSLENIVAQVAEAFQAANV